jgi:hypothetical protein
MCYRRTLMVTGLLSLALVANPGFAQDQAIVGIQTQTNYFVEGRIGAVDPTARTVTITQTDGTSRTLSVSPAATNLASTKVGDNVALNIDETRSFVLSGRNTRTPQSGSAGVAATVSTGQGVAGAAASHSIANWWVTAVDPGANTITLVNQGGGPVRTYNVTTQAGREQLPRVKAGDSLTEINNRVAVVVITPK